MSILITGGTGFAGSYLVEHLVSQNTPASEIHVTSMSGNPGRHGSVLPSENVHQINLTATDAVNQLIAQLQPQQIYHLASISDVSHSFEQAGKILSDNDQLQANLLQAVVTHAPTARLLMVSSAAVYAPSPKPVDESAPLGPISPYAVSKLSQDLLSQVFSKRYQLDVVVVRPFNHTGPHQQPNFVIPSFAQQIVLIERGELDTLLVGNLDAVRDFSDVRDIVTGYTLLMNSGESGQIYNIGSGTGLTIKSVLDELCTLAQADITVTQDPKRMRPSDVPYSVCDTTKISQLGWQPSIPLNQTLTDILEFWRTQQ